MFGKKASNSSVEVEQIESTNQNNALENSAPAKAPIAQENSTLPPAPAKGEPSVSELERLRDILFGSQARSTDKQLTALKSDLNATQQDLKDEINQKFDTLAKNSHNETQAVRTELSERITVLTNDQTSDLRSAKTELTQRVDQLAADQDKQLRATHRELTERVDEQAALQSQQLRIAQQELAEQIEKLATDIFSQLRETQKTFNDRVDRLEASQSERLRNLQLQTQQRDDAHREELINLTKSLDHRKTSRHDLGQMLVELGQRLYTDKDN